MTRSWAIGTIIDYFVCSSGLDKLLSQPAVQDGTTLATHRPVTVAFEISAKPTYFNKLVLPEEALKTSKQVYLDYLFLLMTDNNRYGEAKATFGNNYLMGKQEYP